MNNEDSLFKIELNEKGTQSILRIYRVVQVCFWMGIIVNLTMLFFSLRSYFKYISILKSSSNGTALKFLILIIYMIVFSCCYFLQFYYYLKFAKQSKNSIQINDSDSFNKSLSWLYRALSMTAIGVGLNGLYTIYIIFGDKAF